MKKNILYSGLAALLLSFTASCESSDNEFPDFDYQTVYFANQLAVRTIELGEDEFVDNTGDNEHRFSINAAWGGGYTNRQNVIIDYVVDPSLCDRLYFKGTDTPLTLMPESYYELGNPSQIAIPRGEIKGGVDVYLTDAFFADEKSVTDYYVIPLRMTHVEGADSILMGAAGVEDPMLTNSGHWNIQPKNYVLYAVKYVNPYHGEYLRRGIDQAVINGVSSTIVRHEEYVENDETVQLTTKSLTGNILSLSARDASNNIYYYDVRLDFKDDGSCVMSSASDNVEVTGQGKFVKDGEKNSLGGKDRDAIYLDYKVNFTDKDMSLATRDTLVLHTRNVVGGKTFEIDIK